MSTVSSRKIARQHAQANHRAGRSTLPIWLIGGAMLFVVILVGVIKLNNLQPALVIAQPDLPSAWIDRATIGKPDAKVLIEAYEDFFCTHCLEWHTTVQPKLMEEYIQPGKARFTFINFPVTTAIAGPQLAAQASQCAADQQAFWPYHDQLFAIQQQGLEAFTYARLVDYATALGLAEDPFTQCMSSSAHQAAIATAVQHGLDRGVTGTPMFFVNGQAVSGDYAALQAAIEQQLKADERSPAGD